MVSRTKSAKVTKDFNYVLLSCVTVVRVCVKKGEVLTDSFRVRNYRDD